MSLGRQRSSSPACPRVSRSAIEVRAEKVSVSRKFVGTLTSTSIEDRQKWINRYRFGVRINCLALFSSTQIKTSRCDVVPLAVGGAFYA